MFDWFFSRGFKMLCTHDRSIEPTVLDKDKMIEIAEYYLVFDDITPYIFDYGNNEFLNEYSGYNYEKRNNLSQVNSEPKKSVIDYKYCKIIDIDLKIRDVFFFGTHMPKNSDFIEDNLYRDKKYPHNQYRILKHNIHNNSFEYLHESAKATRFYNKPKDFENITLWNNMRSAVDINNFEIFNENHETLDLILKKFKGV